MLGICGGALGDGIASEGLNADTTAGEIISFKAGEGIIGETTDGTV